MSRFLCTMLLSTVFLVPLAAHALDAETTYLEHVALCQAMPYRCPNGPGPAPAPASDPTDVLCTQLAQSTERGTPAAVDNDRLWHASCRAWQARQDAMRRQTASTYRSSPSLSTTIDCVTTWDDGPYSSR